jgi:hypothetical protein
MAHSLIPIVVGYIFAHYLTFLVERGQQTVIQLADPFGRGWKNLLGPGNRRVSYVLSTHPSVLATIKVGFVVTGHIAAVIAARPLWRLTWVMSCCGRSQRPSSRPSAWSSCRCC